jgi:hypothetical protein
MIKKRILAVIIANLAREDFGSYYEEKGNNLQFMKGKND